MSDKITASAGAHTPKSGGKSELDQWTALLRSGCVSHIRPRKWCGVWILHAYNNRLSVPLVGSIADSPEAYQAARAAGIPIEDLL